MGRRGTAAPTTEASAEPTAAPTTDASGESSAPAEGESYELQGTAGLANDAFWVSLMCGGTAAAKAAGSTIEWKSTPTAGDAATEQGNMDAVALANPDGLLLTAYATPFAPGYIKGLMDKGIPVVITNALSESSLDYYMSVTSAPADDNVVEMGQLIVENTGDSGKVLVLGGIPGIPGLEARWMPARDAVQAENPNIEFLETQYEEFDVNTATQIVSAAIVGNPDLKAVYTTSGPSGEGAVTAVQQAGKSGEILIYSFDATPPIVQGLRDGEVAALLAQPARLMGEQGVQKLIEYLDSHPDGGPVTPADPVDQPIPTMVLTQDNIDSPEAQGYIYEPTCDA